MAWQTLPNGKEQLGDVHAFHFADEPDVALFIPESGDVLLCSANEWQRLKNPGASVKPQIGENAQLTQLIEVDETADDLKTVLANLGATIA